MDRRLKERLVGASILVALIVLIVPELLSGPGQTHKAPATAGAPAEILRNVTVDLATSKASADDPAAASAAPPPPSATPPTEGRAVSPPAGPGVAEQTPGDAEQTPGDAERPPGDADTLAPGAAERAAPPVIALRAPPPAPDGQPATSTSPMTHPGAARAASAPKSHRTWAVQIDSFASRANADQEAHRLAPHERSVHVSAGGKGASLRYRVRVGPFDDRAAAEQAMLRLRKEGLSPSLIPP